MITAQQDTLEYYQQLISEASRAWARDWQQSADDRRTSNAGSVSQVAANYAL